MSVQRNYETISRMMQLKQQELEQVGSAASLEGRLTRENELRDPAGTPGAGEEGTGAGRCGVWCSSGSTSWSR